MDSLTKSDSYMIDKLRTIRPFTESQLLLLYNNKQLDDNQLLITQFVERNVRNDSNELYALLIKLEKARERQHDCTHKISQLKTSCEALQQNVWQLNNKCLVRTNRCADSRLVETKHNYNEALIVEDVIKRLEKSHLWLRDTVANENCINSFLAQFIHLEIENFMTHIINQSDYNTKSNQLRNSISALFAYQRRCLILDNDLIKLSLNWLLNISAEFISMASLDDHLFILNHVLRCAAGSSVWSSCLIQCPNPMSVSDSELATQYMNHCITVVSTILSPIIAREKFIGISKKSKNGNSNTDETWLLVDPDVNDGEDVTNSRLQIAELDVIRFLRQVPFNDVLKFAAMTKTVNDVSNGSSFAETTELKMLKLLAFSTKLIQILKQGLQSFNCLRFKELTIYISSMIRRTVLVVSDLWINCKTEFVTHDQALILRLQVEFDHFMLRSMIAILTTNRQGVWNFLSVFPFDGVSESMMWHILWVVYNNGRDELDELGGLCPYFSANYWKNKFQEATVQYLFKEKLASLTLTESQSLLCLMYNMASSRNNTESEYISTIIKEIFEISFQSPQLSSYMTEKGKQIIIKLIERFNPLINVIIKQLLECETNNEECIDLFSEIPLNVWIPEEQTINVLYEWVVSYPIDSILNRIARIIFSRLNWSFSSTKKELFLDIEKHQNLAVKIYLSIINHIAFKSPKDVPNINKQFGSESLLSLAKSSNAVDFTKWCWSLMLTLKLHSLEQTDQTWDFVFSDQNIIERKTQILKLNFDSNLIPICRGLEELNPFAIYLAIIMTDFGQNSSIEKCIDLIEILLSNQHNIPVLHIMFCFIPFHIKQYDVLLSNYKLISLLSQMFAEYNVEVVEMISHQLTNICDKENKLKLMICWTELLFEMIGSILKSHASSWFSSGLSKLQQIAFIFDKIANLVYLDEDLKSLYIKYLSENPYDIHSWKLPTSNWFSSLFNWSSNSPKKCEWITPLHLIQRQNQNYVWLGWLLIESDSIRMEKIWEELVVQLNQNSNLIMETAIKSICNAHNHSQIPTPLLPINSRATQVINSPISPPSDLEPIIWFKFFTLFFTSSDSSGSIGLKFIDEETRKKLINKLNKLIDYHHRLWLSSNPDEEQSNRIHDKLTKLYRAYILWLEDSQLHDVFVNVEQLPPQYLKDLLKCAIANTSFNEFQNDYINLKNIEIEISKYYNLWLDLRSTSLTSYITSNLEEKSFRVEDEVPLNAPEAKKSNLEAFNIDIETINNSAALLLLIQHNVRVVLEEAKFFENLLNKFDNLNKSLMESLPDLYHNIKKEVKLKIACDKDDYDPNGCSGPALIDIEFIEATLNQHAFKQIERNRIDFENTLSELIETPTNKVVYSSLFIEKSIKILIKTYDFREQNDVERTLLGSLLSWLNDSNSLYGPSKQVFTTLLDSLESIAEIRCDETNMFVLETAINHPKIIEYLAPRLFPSKTSTQCFLNMYELIQEKLTKSPPQVSFVLLSKFDVSFWLKNASHNQCLSLIEMIGKALYSFGNKPNEENLVVLGLYRKHLHYAIIFHFPEYLTCVLDVILKGMKSLTIAPFLWNDVLLSFGFFVTKEDIDYTSFYLELKKYSNNQPLFTANELYDILSTLSTFMREAYQELPLEFLDHFKLYVQKYLALLSTLSFCWLNANSRMPPCDILNVWRPFYDNWKVWLFPKRSTRFVSSENFNTVWELFLMNVHYFVECFQGMLSSILSCVWQVVLSYIIDTKAISPSDLVIIQNKIQTLQWNKFCPNIVDIKLMYDAVIQDKYSCEPFIAYVCSKIDWGHTLRNQSLTIEQISSIVENLSYTLVSLASQKCISEVNLYSIPFELLTAAKVQSINHVIIRVIRLKSYFFEENNSSHGFLISLLKEVSQISSNDIEVCDRDWFLKHKYYANSISHLIKDLNGSDNDLVTKYPNQLRLFITQCFEDLKYTFQSDIDSTERIAIFSELLNCVNDLTNEDIRKIVTEQYAFCFNFENPSLICDLIQSTCLTVKSIPNFLILIETYITNYFNNEGDITKLIEIFQFSLNVDDFMVASVTRNACLTLHLYLFKKLATINEPKRFITSFIGWCSQLRPNIDDEGKVLLLWYKTLLISDSLIDRQENSVELMQSMYRMCKSLFDIVEETVYQGFLSFMRSTKKSFSARCTFLILCLSLHGSKRLLDSIISDSPMNSDVNTLFKSGFSKLQSLRKNKSFVELLPLIEKMITVLDQKDSSIESSELIKNWLITFYSDQSFIKSLLF